jgi:hypothetical protein
MSQPRIPAPRDLISKAFVKEPDSEADPDIRTAGYPDWDVPKLLLAIQEDASYTQPYRHLAAYYAHMGRLDEAREIVRRLRAITPLVVPDAGYLRNTEHRDVLLSGLRLAAGEAT